MRVRASLILAALLAVAWSAEEARADPILSGNLVGVYTETGSFFGENGSLTIQTYTVLHLAEYAPGSDYAGGLIPIAFPAEEGSLAGLPGVNVEAGSEFFIAGSIYEMTFEGVESHLLLSSSKSENAQGNGGSVPSRNGFEQLDGGLALHEAMVQGFDTITDGGPIQQMDSMTFWNMILATYFGELGAEDFLTMQTLGPNGPIAEFDGLLFGVESNEEVFGHTGTPVGSGTIYLGGDPTGTNTAFLNGNGEFFDELGNPVPEPGSLVLIAGGLGALVLLRRRRKSA